jgi:hypothetical protein
VQERSSQYFAVAVLPVRRRNHEACVTDLCFCRISTARTQRTDVGHKYKWGETHMRGPPRIIRLDVVEPDESVLPAPPSARGLDVRAGSVVAVRGADSDDHVRRPEIRLEGRAAVRWRLLWIRPPRLDLGREHSMRVFDEAAGRVVQSQMVQRQSADWRSRFAVGRRRRGFCWQWQIPSGRWEQIDRSASGGCDGTIR